MSYFPVALAILRMRQIGLKRYRRYFVRHPHIDWRGGFRWRRTIFVLTPSV